MISEPDNPEGFEEVHTKVIDSIYDILKDNQNITKWYRIDKARNAIVFEPPSRDAILGIEHVIAVVSELELLRQKYPVEITKEEYNNRYVITVDKIKYRKFIVAKLLK